MEEQKQNFELLTASEVAERLRTSAWMVYEWQRNGTIPAGVAVKIGRRTFFNANKFEDWIAAGGSQQKVEVA